MAIPSIGSSFTTQFIRDMQSMRSDMEDLQRQFATGRRAETYGGLGGDRDVTLNLQEQLASIGSFRDTITTLDLRFSFADLCEQPRGAADFLAIARAYRTMLLDDVPRIGRHMRNEAKRFIMLIDTLYDNHIRLVVSAECEPDELYTDGIGTEAFEFARTVSRLFEMQSDIYMALGHGAE